MGNTEQQEESHTHTTVEVVAFPYAYFRPVSSLKKPRLSGSHTTWIYIPSIIPPSPMSWFKYTYKNRWPSMSWKNCRSHWAHGSSADDLRHDGQYSQKMQSLQTSWRRPLWVIFSVPIKTVLNSLSGASFIFFLWSILFELCSHSRCQSRKIIL